MMNRTEPLVQVNPIMDDDEALFEELRQEIHMVKFPEEMKKKPKKKTVTTTVNGKKVKQRKDGDDDDDTPLELTLLGSSKKGDVFRRADGKRVRLVKKKDKKKRKKEEAQKFKEEIARLRVEAMIREEQQEYQSPEVSKSVSADKESDSESVGSGYTAETADETITSTSISSPGWDLQSPEPTAKTQRVELDLEAVAEVPTLEPVSTEVHQPEEDEDSISDAAAQYVKQLAIMPQEDEDDLDGPTVHSSNSSNVFQTDTPNQSSLLQDLDDEEEEGLSSVERMRLKSIKALEQANRLKRLSEFAKEMGDLKSMWFRDVNRPRHPTQAPRGPAFIRTNTL